MKRPTLDELLARRVRLRADLTRLDLEIASAAAEDFAKRKVIQKVTPASKTGRTFSAAARRRMSAGMREFWKRRKAATVGKKGKK